MTTGASASVSGGGNRAQPASRQAALATARARMRAHLSLERASATIASSSELLNSCVARLDETWNEGARSQTAMGTWWCGLSRFDSTPPVSHKPLESAGSERVPQSSRGWNGDQQGCELRTKRNSAAMQDRSKQLTRRHDFDHVGAAADLRARGLEHLGHAVAQHLAHKRAQHRRSAE